MGRRGLLALGTRYRVAHERASHPEVPDAIQPEVVDPLGDLRRIRNNMLHGGVATKDNAGGCKVLRWFKDGERIHVPLRHVLDFLNQMGWLAERPTVLSNGPNTQACWWHLNRDNSDRNIPALLSVRPMLDTGAEDPSTYRYGASCSQTVCSVATHWFLAPRLRRRRRSGLACGPR